MSEVSLATATSPQDIEAVKELVVEYAKTLPFDLGYQDFDDELASFPGKYAPPEGCQSLRARRAKRPVLSRCVR